MFDFCRPHIKKRIEIEYSDLIVCFSILKGKKFNCFKLILFLLGKYSSRNRLSRCLNENLMNQIEDKPFHEILFDINASMKKLLIL